MIYVFILGNKCNMKCKFCMSVEKELEREFIIKKLKELKEGLVVFTGGEPLLYNVNEYLKIAKMRGLKTKVQTNGKLIELLDLDLTDVVNLPVDGCRKTHDWLREKGHFDIVLKAAEIIRGKVDLSITTVLTSKNINEIEEIYEIVKYTNAKSWKLFKFKPKGRGKFWKKLSISENEFLKAVKLAKEIADIKVYAVRDPDKMNAKVFRLI